MFAGKPIIGIAGGIGSGKSFVGKLFGEMGCHVINSDEQVRHAYRDPAVQDVLRQWWGSEMVGKDGEINRSAIAKKVFADPNEKGRLERLLHPWVHEARQREMQAFADDAQVLAFVWDTPLLLEAGLATECDAIVYVDAPSELRLSRVKQARAWDQAELESRENLQMPLDKKREISDYVVSNTAGADQVRVQVREVLSRILAGLAPTTGSQ